MKNSIFIVVILCIIALCNSVYGASDQACKNVTNPTCDTCLKVDKCAFCKTSKICFLYDGSNAFNPSCSTADMQWETCVGSFQVWIIVVSVIGGIALIAILITVWCLCRKCKHCRIRKEERRQERDDQRMEERRAAAEVRSTERNRVADQIRMKYGILKANDNATDYSRMN